MSHPNILLSTFAKRCRQPMRIEYYVTESHNQKSTWLITNKQPNTYMYLYGHKFKTIAMKRNAVNQSSSKIFNQLIQEYQVCKTVP